MIRTEHRLNMAEKDGKQTHTCNVASATFINDVLRRRPKIIWLRYR